MGPDKEEHINKMQIIQCKDISQILKESNISRLNLFVLDVEGAEISVLKDMDQVLLAPSGPSDLFKIGDTSNGKGHIIVDVLVMECEHNQVHNMRAVSFEHILKLIRCIINVYFDV